MNQGALSAGGIVRRGNCPQGPLSAGAIGLKFAEQKEKVWKQPSLAWIQTADISFYPLPDRPVLGSSNSTANKDMMSKIWTNGDRVI